MRRGVRPGRGGAAAVSRGPGRLQRVVVEVLYAAEGCELPRREVRRALGDPDGGNFRRAVRSLVARGVLEEHEDGRLGLTFWGHMSCALREMDEEERRRQREEREREREFEEGLAAMRAEHAARIRLWREEEALWSKPVPDRERRRFPGANELRILAVLVRYAPYPQLGLPRGAVWRIAGGEKANGLRAIRSLIGRAIIQQTHDGERIRLPGARPMARFFSLWGITPNLLDPPLDDELAEAVLKGFGVPVRGVAD